MSFIAPAETQEDLARRYKVILRRQTLRRFLRMRSFYVLLSLSLGLLILLKYVPIYGALIAFKDFNVTKGILGSRGTTSPTSGGSPPTRSFCAWCGHLLAERAAHRVLPFRHR